MTNSGSSWHAPWKVAQNKPLHNKDKTDAESGGGPSAGPGDEDGVESGLVGHDAMRRPGALMDDKLWAFEGESEVECLQGDVKMEASPVGPGTNKVAAHEG